MKTTKKIKVCSIFGTRPEAIKMAPLVLEMKNYDQIESMVCVTAQHREMLDQVLDAFGIVPDYDLDIMEKSQTLSKITSKAMLGLEEVFAKDRPDIVLVHGDTTTTFAGALAAFYAKIDVGHVEAGLRTGDIYSPYPEEMNRLLVSKIAAMHFAPTVKNAQNLENEGIVKGISITGNTVIDSIKYTARDNYVFECDALNHIDFSKKTILMTAHRRENYGEPFDNICQAAAEIAKKNPDIQIIYPVHLSPYVREMAGKYLSEIENIHLIDPVGVFDMHNLIKRSYLVLTDSGGLQEEAPSLGKPVLVMRQETERPEAIAAGTARLVGVEKANIIEVTEKLLNDENEYAKMAKAVNPYGDGNASKRIIEAIIARYEE
ncbi:MAG: UDP-N-acetylglucosamine 2-epimerase (non-hydrolyzing) [Clostridia bacterium]|nr:UDP-N-acetylglucosamine 2-epimerase (non-hydrolyzing) [Clostridia bacterium]MBQ6933040.1 UDP-N-acetylglucosamine 2-epimerase (non-hydrolyzing) [Clostridia bacterium]